jgi:hypothetical protein
MDFIFLLSRITKLLRGVFQSLGHPLSTPVSPGIFSLPVFMLFFTVFHLQGQLVFLTPSLFGLISRPTRKTRLNANVLMDRG